jgi:uncharacterized membrane protein
LKKALRQAVKKLSGVFIQGLAITLPITLTAALLYWLVSITESFVGDLIRTLFPDFEYRPGLGTLAAVAVVFAAGVLMNVWAARQLVLIFDGMLDHVPLVKTIYGGLRDIATFLSKKDTKSGFRKVVAVRFASDVRLVGFVTVEDFSALAMNGKDKSSPLGVYLPMGYQIGGFTVFVPRTAVEPLDMSVEDAMRFTLTAGVSGGKELPA